MSGVVSPPSRIAVAQISEAPVGCNQYQHEMIPALKTLQSKWTQAGSFSPFYRHILTWARPQPIWGPGENLSPTRCGPVAEGTLTPHGGPKAMAGAQSFSSMEAAVGWQKGASGRGKRQNGVWPWVGPQVEGAEWGGPCR